MRNHYQISGEIRRLKNNLYLAKSREETKGAVAWLDGAIKSLEWVLENGKS